MAAATAVAAVAAAAAAAARPRRAPLQKKEAARPSLEKNWTFLTFWDVSDVSGVFVHFRTFSVQFR